MIYLFTASSENVRCPRADSDMGKHVVGAQQGCVRGPTDPKVRPSPRPVSSFHISPTLPLLNPPGSAKPLPSWLRVGTLVLQGRALKHSSHCREDTTDSSPLQPPHSDPFNPLDFSSGGHYPARRRSHVPLCVCVAQSCPTLCDPMGCIDCSLSSSSVHRILQARILERVAISFSRGSSQPRDQPRVSCMAGRFFTV